MGIFSNFEQYTKKDRIVKGSAGIDGIGFKLTDDGNLWLTRLTIVIQSV